MSNAWNAFPMLDRLLDDVASGVAGTAFGTASNTATFAPAIDLRANDDELVFVCDVPGVKQDDLDLTLDGGTLTIKGQRRGHGTFERSFALPELVNVESMTADLADGVLTIRVPKKPEAKPRKIPIGGGAANKQLAEKKE